MAHSAELAPGGQSENQRGGQAEGRHPGERQNSERPATLDQRTPEAQHSIWASAPETPTAAASPRPDAGELPAAVPVIPEPAPETITAPPKELVLTIPAAREGDAVLASVHVRDQNGAVEIAVRTPDAQLSSSLQEGLPDLVTRLEAPGFEATAQRGQDQRSQDQRGQDQPDPDRRSPDSPEANADGHRGRGQAREERLARWRESLGLAATPTGRP